MLSLLGGGGGCCYQASCPDRSDVALGGENSMSGVVILKDAE